MMDEEKIASVLRKYVPPLAQNDVELICRDIAEMLETTRKTEPEPTVEPISKSRKLTGDKPRTNLVKPNKK